MTPPTGPAALHRFGGHTRKGNDPMQENEENDVLAENQKKFRCRICGYIFIGSELPRDFRCPRCGSDSEQFIELRQR